MATQLTPEQMATLPALPPPPGVEPNFDNPEDRKPMAIALIALVLVLMLSFVSLRVCARTKLKTPYGWDDWTSIASAICAVGIAAVSLDALVVGGIGPHMWNLHPNIFTIAFSMRLLAIQILYPITILLVKLSLFLLFFRVFRLDKRAKYFIYFGIAMITIFYTLSLVLMLYYCVPRPGDGGNLHETCASQGNAVTIAFSAFNMVSDVYLLSIPIPIVWHLNMPLRRKLGIGAVLLTGLLATVCSILTLYFRNVFETSPDLSWELVPSIITGNVEVNIGIICGCLPCLPALWRHMGPKDSSKFSLRHLFSRLTVSSRSQRSEHYPLSDGSMKHSNQINSQKLVLSPNASSIPVGDDYIRHDDRSLEMGYRGSHPTIRDQYEVPR